MTLCGTAEIFREEEKNVWCIGNCYLDVLFYSSAINRVVLSFGSRVFTFRRAANLGNGSIGGQR